MIKARVKAKVYVKYCGIGDDILDQLDTQPEHVISGKKYYSQNNRIEEGAMPSIPGQEIIPGKEEIVIPGEKYLEADIKVKGDQNLVAENIKEGVKIYEGTDGEIVGTHAGGGSVNIAIKEVTPDFTVEGGLSNSGYVGSIFVNANVSVEEVTAMLAQLTIDEITGMYMIAVNANLDKMIAYIPGYGIMYQGEEISGMLFNDGVGWGIEGVVELPFNDNVISEASDGDMTISGIGAQNNLLASIFTDKGEEIISKEKEITGEFNGASLQITENQTIDVEALLDENRLPFEIEVNVEPNVQSYKYVSPKTEYQVVKPDEGYDGLAMVEVGKVNVESSQIKEGVTIYGVTGTVVDILSKINNVTREELDLSTLCPGQLTIGEYELAGWSNLKSVKLDPETYHIYDYAFAGCNKLTNIDLHEGIKYINNHAFTKCWNFTKIKVPNSATSIGEECFSYCYNLETIDLGEGITVVNSLAFRSCYSLKKIILRAPQVCKKYDGYVGTKKVEPFYDCYHLDGTVHATYNPNGDKDCYIYVPDDLVDSYKNDVGWFWNVYADQIKPLSEYVEE